MQDRHGQAEITTISTTTVGWAQADFGVSLVVARCGFEVFDPEQVNR